MFVVGLSGVDMMKPTIAQIKEAKRDLENNFKTAKAKYLYINPRAEAEMTQKEREQIKELGLTIITDTPISYGFALISIDKKNTDELKNEHPSPPSSSFPIFEK